MLRLVVATLAVVMVVNGAKCTLPPRRILSIPGVSQGLGYYATSELGKLNADATLVVSYQHGMYEDPDVHFCAIQGAMLKRYPDGNKNILLIAPHFCDYGCSEKELSWPGQSWNKGDNSSENPSVSSFSVYDHMIYVLSNKVNYPNLKKIVLVGHSAGGQTMVRYALGARATFPEGFVRFVSSNPSSFPYLNEERPVAPGYDTFKVPSKAEIKSCSDYNSWRYGLEDLNEYMETTGKETAINQWKPRDVVYLLGTADTCNEYIDPTCDSHGLDKGCEAMMTGRWRYERGCAWFRYIKHFYGQQVHRQVDVQGVAHDETKMVQANEALPVFFD